VTKKTDKDFRIVEQVVNAQLAERDAEIAQLKAELAECQIKSGMWEHSYEEALKDVSYMEADIKELKEQVVKLRIHNWPLVARVAALSAKLSDSQSDVETLLTTVSQQRQYIESLKSQVAELRAWKDAVPVDAICRVEMTTTKQFMLGATAIGYAVDDFDADRAAINGWLKAERPD